MPKTTIKLDKKFAFKKEFTTYVRETIYTYQDGNIYVVDCNDGLVVQVINVDFIKNPIRCYYFDRYVYVYNYEDIAYYDVVNHTLSTKKMVHSSSKNIVYSSFSEFRHTLIIYSDLTVDIYNDKLDLVKTSTIDKDFYDDFEQVIALARDFEDIAGFITIQKSGAVFLKLFATNEVGLWAIMKGYIGDNSAIYQPYPGYLYYKTKDGFMRYTLGQENSTIVLPGVLEILYPSYKLFAVLFIGDQLIINNHVYSDIKMPIKLFGQHNQESIVVDADNILHNLTNVG